MKLQQCMDVSNARHKDHLPFSQVPIVAYKRISNIGNLLARARLTFQGSALASPGQFFE